MENQEASVEVKKEEAAIQYEDKVVSLPKSAKHLSENLAQLILDIRAAKQSGASGIALISGAVAEGIQAIAKSLPDVGQIDDEMVADSMGVIEAFAIAGFEVAKKLK